MDKKIYEYLKDEDVLTGLVSEIVASFKTKMNKDTVDYSYDIAKGTGQIKTIEPNTFFHFDTDKKSIIDKFKKALFDDDLEGLTQSQENMLVEDVSEFLKEIAVKIIEDHEQEIRDELRKNIMPGSSPEDFPFERIFITSIDIADWSAFTESQKYLLKIGKEPGAFINTETVVTYIQNRQEDEGMTVEEVFEEAKREENPLFKQIVCVEQGNRYIYDVDITMFVDYSLAEKSMEKLTTIKEAAEPKMTDEELDDWQAGMEKQLKEKTEQAKKLLKKLKDKE